MFCAGMLWVSVWTLADGFANSFVQLAIFRALQGVGAAMTVPSAVGIISSYFVKEDRNRSLSIFAAAGAVGFYTGLVFGGFLTSSLGWRYVFWLSVIVTAILGIIGWIILPVDRRKGVERPKLDFAGAALSTGGLILFSFVLSSGGR
jgi:MFS family permease